MLIGGSGTLLIFINMKDYRRLTEDEVLQLKSQSCLADDWGNVSVAEGFNCEYVHHTRFSGEVKLGVFDAEFTLPGGIRKHSGLRHVTLHNVTVGETFRTTLLIMRSVMVPSLRMWISFWWTGLLLSVMG